MKQFPKVNIVVLNYNGKDCVRACLTSLFRIDYPNFEVVFVDNNSTDGSLEATRQYFPRATFIKNEQNLGFSAGNNVGIRYSLEKMADFVFLLNNDTKVERNFLTKLIGAVQADQKIGLASPLILKADTQEIWFSGGKIDWLKMKTRHADSATDFISGCAMLVRADVFSKIGLFDEDFFLYWEDVDFSLRARNAGYSSLVVRDASVRHFEKSEQNKKNKTYWLVLSGLLFFKKNTPKQFSLWPWFYLILRKTKNRLDLHKNTKIEIALSVQKAYRDFKKVKTKK